MSLVGDRLADLVEGEEYEVKGTLSIIRHDATIVNGVFVPAGQPG